MKKVKAKPIVKYHDGDKYVFIRGVAEVPGIYGRQGITYKITLKEFNELCKKEKSDE